MTETQADQRIELLGKLASGHQSDFTALFFNRIYAAPTPQFNTAPNAFLVDMTAGLKPGTALDAAMGQGQNAIYLASKGWQVTGFDIAEKGLELAQAEAERRGLHITTVKSSHTDFDFGHELWDLVVFSYAWAPLLAPEFVNRVRESLKPGGLILIEQPAEELAGSRDPIDEVNALLKAWGGFRILRHEDTLGQWDWRIRKARVLRLLAQK